MATTTSSQVLRCPRYNSSWKISDTDNLITLHRTLTKQLQNLPYGPMEAAMLLLGENQARVISQHGEEFLCRPKVDSPKKRKTIVDYQDTTMMPTKTKHARYEMDSD